jgi:hypothetical protein
MQPAKRPAAKFRRATVGALALVLGLVLDLGLAPAADAGEFMFMPTAAYVQSTRNEDDPALEKRQLLGDLFYSGDHGRLRLLAELQLERDGYDMERLQAGWRSDPNTSLWFGRFHNPVGYWNLEHHHGHFMETSAERPRILEFEDEGGPLPIHLTGFLLQGVRPLGEASLQYDVGVATGPRLKEGELDPVDVVRAPRWNKLATVARVAYRPDATSDDQFGAFVARTRIPGADVPFDLDQTLFGVYFSRDFGPLRLFGEGFRVRHRIARGEGTPWPSYWAGYLQAEYKLVPAQWTLFGRHEALSSRMTAEYAALFPNLPKRRDLAGVRWDFMDNQALKLEWVRDTLLGGSTFNGIEVQWSAMFQW